MEISVRLVFVCIAVTSMVTLAKSAVFYSLPSIDPAHAGKCWSPRIGRLFRVGEEFTDKSSCQRVTCNPDFSMTWSTCGPIEFSAEMCNIVEDNTKNYPDCCPQMKC